MKTKIPLLCFIFLGIFNSHAQIINTIAGGGPANFGGDGGAATSAEMAAPFGLAMDVAGNIYIADNQNNCIRKVNTSGIITTIAGTGVNGYGGDGGNATSAMLNLPEGVVVDASNNIYFSDTYNNRIRVVNTSGIISTFAGSGIPGFSGDGGPATSSELSTPAGIAIDASGNLYISDAVNERIRIVNTSKVISTIAGNGSMGYYGDGGSATLSELNNPQGVAVDALGNIYVADAFNEVIREINSSGIISTFAGSAFAGFSGDGGQATSAELNYPYAVAVDGSGNVYVPDYQNTRVRIIHTSGIIATFAGNGFYGFTGDGGSATSAELNGPTAVCSSGGKTYISDGNNRVRLVNSSGIISTFAGSSNIAPIGDGGPATAASLAGPFGICSDNIGNIYVADYFHQRFRMINTAGIITTVAGNGISGNSGDGGPATSAEFEEPLDVSVDRLGQLYLCDAFTPSVRMVNTSGIINTIAGGTGGYSGDGGPATLAEMTQVGAVYIDNAGNLFLGDEGNYRIRKVNTSGIISTFVGNGVLGFSGDGGPATSAEVDGTGKMAEDGNGNFYFSDQNYVVRMVNTSGIISTIAGNAGFGFYGDGGPATNAEMAYPWGLAFDNSGNLYIADDENNGIRMVNTSGIISTAVGNEVGGFYGDGGLATDAELANPEGVTFDPAGDLFFVDGRNNRVREVTFVTTAILPVNNKDENVSIFPNPANNVVYISLNGTKNKSTFVLYDISGRELSEQTIKNEQQFTLNTSTLISGIYFVKIITEDGASIIKKVEIIH